MFPELNASYASAGPLAADRVNDANSPPYYLFMSPVTLVLIAIVSIMIPVVSFGRIKLLYALRKIPSPQALPIIGNAIQLNCSLEEFFAKLLDWSREFGDIYLLWVGHRPFVFLYRVEVVQPLLSSSVHIDKSLEYQFLEPWLGTGLLTSSGEKWHTRRKLLTSTFHSELTKDYFQVMTREAEIFVSCLGAELGKTEFDVVPYAKRAALDVICECAMGCPVNAQTNCNNEYVTAVNSLAIISQMRFTNILIKCDSIFKLTALGKEYENALRIIHSFVDKVIAKRRAMSEESETVNPPTKMRTLLDLLLSTSKEGHALTNADIKEEVNTFMFAGHDTVGTSISWILYALGRHPEYQDKILEESEAVLGSERLTYESLQKLVWLDACIKESWRLYPVAPLIARQLYKPIVLHGTEIPQGSTVLVNSYLLHRDPRHFPDPDAYQPERFLPDSRKYPSFAYIPFSAGSRNCIGAKFATMEVKVMLLSLLRSYEFRAIDHESQLRFVSQLVLDNVGGIRLSISPRQPRATR